MRGPTIGPHSKIRTPVFLFFHLLRVCLCRLLDSNLFGRLFIELAARLAAVSFLQSLPAGAFLFCPDPIGGARIFGVPFQRFLQFSNFVPRIRHILLFHLLLLIPRFDLRFSLAMVRSRDCLLSCLLLDKMPARYHLFASVWLAIESFQVK
jgi:hypothetical protein